MTTWPALLTGTPAPGTAGNRWHIIDEAGAALPLAERESQWTLLAVSGGNPVTIAGEWNGREVLPLTVWHGDQAVPL